MAVHLTPAQARAMLAGHDATVVGDLPGPRTTKRVAKAAYETECVLDHERFTTRAAEDRHFIKTGHPRYALVLTLAEKEPK